MGDKQIDEKSGANKPGPFGINPSTTSERKSASGNYADVRNGEEDVPKIRAKRGPKKIPTSRDGDMHKEWNKRGKNKPKGSEKTLSDKRTGSIKDKEIKMEVTENLNTFINSIARDDYSKTESMLQNIVQGKIQQRTQQEVERIRQETK